MWHMVLNLYVFQFVIVFLPNMSFVLYVNIWFGPWYQWIGEGGLQSKNRAGPGKPGQAQMEGIGQAEVNASECPHSLLVKTRDSCWNKGQELSKESGSKLHKRDQAVTRGWSLSFGSWITKDKSERDTESRRAPLMLAHRTTVALLCWRQTYREPIIPWCYLRKNESVPTFSLYHSCSLPSTVTKAGLAVPSKPSSQPH